MPKQKTHRAAKKRFKTTAKGKLLHRHAMRSHNLGKKSSKRKRKFRGANAVAPADAPGLKRLLGRR